jgi:DNA modification methylase
MPRIPRSSAHTSGEGLLVDVLAGRATWCVLHGDASEHLPLIPNESIDAIVTDPIYAEVSRHYGRITERDWWRLMRRVVVPESRRVLKPKGSAVYILQPNSERVGRMRPWVFEFQAWVARRWNMVQDAWWWNFSMAPTVHTQRARGLMRPSIKACVWAGAPDCYRDQESVLWKESDGNAAARQASRALQTMPSGLTMRRGRCAAAAIERGGVTPFNLIPTANAASNRGSGDEGHGAGTPYHLAAWWIRYLCPPGGVVLDMFGGAGTMAEAARDQGRRCILIEKDGVSVARARSLMARAPRVTPDSTR